MINLWLLNLVLNWSNISEIFLCAQGSRNSNTERKEEIGLHSLFGVDFFCLLGHQSNPYVRENQGNSARGVMTVGGWTLGMWNWILPLCDLWVSIALGANGLVISSIEILSH